MASFSITPYYNKPTPDGLIQHYKAIAESTELPIIVYNVPGRPGCNVDPLTLVKLSVIPNIIGVKEASGNIQQMCEVCRMVTTDFIVLSGDDAITLPLMAVGGRGVISVVSNEVPRAMSHMVEAAERGDFAAARADPHFADAADAHQLRGIQPHPREGGDDRHGSSRGNLPLPMVPPRPESRAKIREGAERSRTAEGRLRHGERVTDSAASQLAADIERLYRQGAADGGTKVDRCSRRSARSCAPAEWFCRTRCVDSRRDGASTSGSSKGILVGFRCGDLVDALPRRWSLVFRR